jgi:hypothetical protein
MPGECVWSHTNSLAQYPSRYYLWSWRKTLFGVTIFLTLQWQLNLCCSSLQEHSRCQNTKHLLHSR